MQNMRQVVLTKLTREALYAELTEIALEPAHHDRLEVFFPLYGDAAREAHGIEDLEERAEAVAVPRCTVSR